MSRRRRRRRRRGNRPEAPALPLYGAGLHTAPLPDPLQLAPGRERGAAWLSRRWLAALEAMGGMVSSKGPLPRRESVLALHIEPGLVLAQVQSSRPEPHIVRIDVGQLPAEAWDEAISGMARKAVFAAKLLAGEMPEEIEEAFSEARVGLVPQAAAEVQSHCTCGDPVAPCKHVSSVHALLAEEFSREPFLLFKLRGCPKTELLAALRVRRTGAADAPLAVESENLGPAPSPQAFWRGGDAIREFTINIAPPMTHAALLRQLGVPPIEGGEAFIEMMSALYRRIMESVLEEALKGQRPNGAPEAPPSSLGPGAIG